MHDYRELKRHHGTVVSQTIDAPILVLDYFEISDLFLSLFVILVFGILLNVWEVMGVLLALVLGVLPVVKRRSDKGILLHLPYARLGVSLPGLFNPKGRRVFSD